jgi:hypothetical protein
LAVPVPAAAPRSAQAAPARALPAVPRSAASAAERPGGPVPSSEGPSAAGRALFDGAASAPDLAGRAGAPGPGWSLASFPSDAGGTAYFKRRPGAAGGRTRVYAGGLALNESFEALFARPAAKPDAEYFLWSRAHPPSAWSPVKSPLDADAKDLASMIVRAAAESGSAAVDLVLHSYGAMVFQRMIQLRTADARAARRLLAGSRVTLLNATTHFKDSEKKTGREATQIADTARTFADWLEMMDSSAESWRAAARLNPFLWPQAEAYIAGWSMQKAQALAMASHGAVNMMRKDLHGPWDPSLEPLRKAYLKDLEADSPSEGWQEALALRSADAFRLEFTKRDVARLRRLGVRVDAVFAHGDQLLNWESEKLLLDLLGIPAPDQKPAAGTVLKDPTGRFTARVVDGDHYFPVKKSAELARLLDR